MVSRKIGQTRKSTKCLHARSLKKCLEALYHRYNRRAFVHPDPLEFLYVHENPADREITGIIASSLAYGRVAQILKSVSMVLERMSPSPSVYLATTTAETIMRTFDGFVHRFATGHHLSSLLIGLKGVIQTHGSLQQMFLEGFSGKDPSLQYALFDFARRIVTASCGRTGHLIPVPEKGSACKRLNLFLRWMVRNDSVDPGGWEGIPASSLIVPLDTHLHDLSLRLGFTSRKGTDMTTALEITDRFRRLCPEDPVRYDFILTRFGIRSDMNPDDLIAYLCKAVP